MILRLLFLVASVSSLEIPKLARHGRCQPISVDLCKDIPYNHTMMPNQFHQTTQKEAGIELSQFKALIEIKCSPDINVFLCSMYTPICLDTYDDPIPVCRSVCEQVRSSCLPVMKKYGFDWPEKMSCSTFPEKGKVPLCMDPREGEARQPDETFSFPPDFRDKNPQLFNPIPPSSGKCDCKTCGSDWNKVVNSLIRLRPGDRQYNRSARFGGISNCASPCQSPFLEDDHFEDLEIWFLVVTPFSFACSFVTFMTFLVDSQRFKYPERPVMYISLCYVMVAVGFILRLAYGHEYLACERQDGFTGSTSVARFGVKITDGTPSVLCGTVFFLVYFFGMAATLWWVVLTGTWFLLSGLKWVPEIIAGYSHWFHVFAWGLASLKGGVILALKLIDGDPVSGLCFVGSQNATDLLAFVLIPFGVYLFIGLVFLVAGLIYIGDIRRKFSDQVNSFDKLVVKFSVFSLIYLSLAVVLVGCWIYQYVYVGTWEESVVCSECLPRDRLQKPDFTVLVLKYCLILLLGITPVYWICSEKTFDSWKRACIRLCCCGCAPQTDKQHVAVQQFSLLQQQQNFASRTMTQQTSLSAQGAMQPMAHYSTIPERL